MARSKEQEQKRIELYARIAKLLLDGDMSVEEICQRFNVSEGTVRRARMAHGISLKKLGGYRVKEAI